MNKKYYININTELNIYQIIEYCYNRLAIVNSLFHQLLTTSTQEPNTMAPQSADCICSTKWQAKLIVTVCFGTKTSKFCLRIISFSSLESELSFDLKDSEINFDRARSATQREITA